MATNPKQKARTRPVMTLLDDNAEDDNEDNQEASAAANVPIGLSGQSEVDDHVFCCNDVFKRAMSANGALPIECTPDTQSHPQRRTQEADH